MSGLPIDLALAVAGAGVSLDATDDDLERHLRNAIADRRGYLGDLTIAEHGWQLDLLYPVRETFHGRTRHAALGWCLVYLMGETGELGIAGFSA